MVSNKRIYNWYIALVAAGCMVLTGYDASVFNALQNSHHWAAWFDEPVESPSECVTISSGSNRSSQGTQLIGLINSAYGIGAIVSGWFFAGPTADFLGRRLGMGIGCFVVIIATFFQCFAPRHNTGVFIVGRVLIGIGQGFASTAGPIYIGEITPPAIRGKVMAFWQLFYSVGSFLAYWVNYAAAKHRTSLGEWDWKIVVIFQLLMPVIIIAQLPFMPESPRWYIQKSNSIEQARASLSKVRDTEQDVEDELLQIREAVEFEKEALASGRRAYLTLWQDASVRKRLGLVFVLNMGQQLTGQGTLNSYSSAIYKKIWASADKINLINALNATFGILFTLNAAWTVDRFGRRFLFIVGALGMAMCMFLVAIVGLKTPNVNGTKTESVGIALVFLLFLFIFFYKPSWGATTWIYTSEVFPMNVRAQAVGMASQMQNVSGTIFQQFFPTFYKNCGLKSFFFFVTTDILLAVYVFFLIPETKQRSLEEMDVLFGGANHVEQGAEMMGVKDPRHSHREGGEKSQSSAEVEVIEARR
ncbi:general substrate transporter [Cadophora sp. DSE1049]|nr:general substrate transporter [Cadophora sp. DSE1049]